MCSEDSPNKVTSEVIVKLQEDGQMHSKAIHLDKTPKYPSDELETPVVIIIRAEEILILVIVFIIWIGAIMLFFNRWGKIRMLEPYQPLFMDNSQRGSCQVASMDNIISSRHRMSLSKYNVSCDIPVFNIKQNIKKPNSRPRLNSVFVSSSSYSKFMNYSPRRTKSAVDIHSIGTNEMYTLQKTVSTPIKACNETRKQSLIPSSSSDRYPLIRQKLAKNYAYEFQHKLPRLQSPRRPSSSTITVYEKKLFNKRYRFRSVDHHSSLDHRRTSLATSNVGFTSATSLAYRLNHPMKKSLDRIKTMTSFDQPSFIIESPCETIGNNSLIVEVHEQQRPCLSKIHETDPLIALEENRDDERDVSPKKISRRNSYNGYPSNLINKSFQKNGHSVHDICQIKENYL